LFLGKYDSALDDINHCIEKAEENLPKYFYLRGLTYSVLHNLKKAINEHSICLSLDPSYEKSLVERAKCSFLMGDLDGGFGDLKNFLQSKPDDASVHLWIGDLLYEGRSYHDALKAYLEVR
jgi:tetratricopeptide (TPR) repeat protein